MNVQISISNLGKRYHAEWVFRHLNYTFKSGNIYAITGPNGSGKSTLLQIISGQLPPSEGTLTYHINNRPAEADEVFNYLSFAAPYMDLIDEFTLQEQLQFHFSLKPPLPGFTLQQMMDEMYLTEAANKFLGNFSSGMKQRLKLGLCFFTQCPVLLLDEPASNLDSKAFNWYLHTLARLSKNRLTIIASNNPQEYPPESNILDIQAWKPAKPRVT
jgi:ABC-type multidrug transport system ATPase subunit